MTGRSGQTGRSPARGVTAVPSGVAVLAAGSLLAALGLSACGPDAAHATTVLRSARAASLELADGRMRAATDGMTVPKGATVRTAPGGSASLVAAGRAVLLGSDSAVRVVDGRREQLRQGLVLVDARRSPGLSLDAGEATVTTPRGGLARVERGLLLRAASYQRTISVQAAGRRGRTKVQGLHQVQVPAGGLPGRVTPLALTPHDLWERTVALDLVTADAELVSLADGLDSNPRSTDTVLGAVPASYTSSAPPAAGEGASETALAFVVAEATGRAGPDSYRTVRDLREDGGSWGVVATIVHADVAKVSAALDALLNPTEGPAVLAGGPSAPLSPTGLLGGDGGGTGGAPPTATTSSPRPAGSPVAKPSPKPSASPADPLNDVIATVTNLLPSPSPSSVLPPVPRVAPSPSASPLVSVQLGGIQLGVG